MITKNAAYHLGLGDGREMARNSGTSAAPINGWDGDLINELGVKGVRRLFQSTRTGEWSPKELTLLETYSKGCAVGAAEIVERQQKELAE